MYDYKIASKLFNLLFQPSDILNNYIQNTLGKKFEELFFDFGMHVRYGISINEEPYASKKSIKILLKNLALSKINPDIKNQ